MSMVAGGLEMNAQPRLPGLFEPSRLLRPGGTPGHVHARGV